MTLVRVHNRLDCCPEKLDGFTVRVGNSPNLADNPSCAAVGVPAAHSTSNYTRFVDVPCTNATGRFVFVSFPTSGPKALHFAEAEVFGTAFSPPLVDNETRAEVCARACLSDTDFALLAVQGFSLEADTGRCCEFVGMPDPRASSCPRTHLRGCLLSHHSRGLCMRSLCIYTCTYVHICSNEYSTCAPARPRPRIPVRHITACIMTLFLRSLRGSSIHILHEDRLGFYRLHVRLHNCQWY